ncbi:hypothetical protein F8154_04370 [Alkaliphilus pronyensis]|uniref:GerMN domain-containing protein n=1 Tax=Alkaliphilus pronyensis TaxID=1482732 RepID=A0A6I0FCM0_9FIRM|nr:GerMN domain-containing protein [Alkaliphilus pronyensis]KAB3536316.1 hypothetical protein F8154_04370 [Alkaliphilus pronyensis]
MRSLRNIILLLILCITASGLPLYVDSMDYESLTAISFTSVNDENISFSLDVMPVSTSNYRVDFSISTNGQPVPISFNSKDPVTIDFYLGSKEVMTTPINELTKQQIPIETTILKDAPLNISFDLDQKTLNLPNGDYQLVIVPNIKDLESIRIEDEATYYTTSISFFSSFEYLPSLNSIDNNKTALKLYFSDKDYNHMIPITRVIPYTSTPLRSTLDNLQLGADPNLGISTDSPIPKGAGLSLNNRTANVYLYGDLATYESNSSNAAVAYESFVNSLCGINEVDEVQFYFNNKIVPDGFHGRVMDEPHTPLRGPRLYAGVITETNRMLLAPIASVSTNTSISAIFNMLKYTDNISMYSYYLQPPVPEEVTLEYYSINDGKLTLALNDAFLNIYKDDSTQQSFMIDALLFTLTSLDSVDSVEFKVNNKTIKTLNGIEIPDNTKELFINPEKQY